MKKKFYLLLSTCIYCIAGFATPPSTFSKHIKIDQFGYFPQSRKVAVIVDPQVGYNAAESFNPGTGANEYQVRNWNTDAVVFSGTLVAWNSGNTQSQSGDKGWWFDFTAVTDPGSYYVYDLSNNTASYRFEIGNDVYNTVLKQAIRMYFYQRVNFAKQPPFTDPKWADAAAFSGPNQDYAARSRYDKTNNATAKDLHGGWFDAGDCNKYTTFTITPVCNLLETYRMRPSIFTDDYNIPESGNGIPDILDEVKYELDWLTRMQDATGTNGLLLKLGADNYNSASPPSTDHNPRYYVPECTSATLTGAANFALASTVYASLGQPAMTTYANDLRTRAINAWNRAMVTTSNLSSFETSCDDQNIVSGDADADQATQQELAITAAAYLFEATGNTAYRDAFDAHYTQARPISFGWWGPYYQALQRALLRYTQLPNATASVKSAIQSSKASQNSTMSITDYNNKTDLYRSWMPDDQYTWGSNETKASAGLDNLDFSEFGVNAGNATAYNETAESYLHWFHGVNPMGKVMLTNMYAFGADSSVNEFYHSWFADGTIWDNALTSPNGPAPGYLPGGPNKNFSIQAINPPGGQPAQKSFREWNTGWNGTSNENSWEVTEAAIYTQSAYVSLLARTIANAAQTALPLHSITLTGNRKSGTVSLSWLVDDASDTRSFEVERSTDRLHFTEISTQAANTNTRYSANDETVDLNGSTLYYRIKANGREGQLHYSPVLTLNGSSEQAKLVLYPNPASTESILSGFANTPALMDVRLLDAAGKIVWQDQWQQQQGSFVKNVPVTKLARGVYWMQVLHGTATEKLKLVKN